MVYCPHPDKISSKGLTDRRARTLPSERNNMATSKEYFEFILEQLSGLEGITSRRMMGEYMIYYRGRIAAYLCDDRLLVKPTENAKAMLPDAAYEPPYDGAKDMLLVDRVDDRAFMTALFDAIYDELPLPKPKKAKPLFQEDV